MLVSHATAQQLEDMPRSFEIAATLLGKLEDLLLSTRCRNDHRMSNDLSQRLEEA